MLAATLEDGEACSGVDILPCGFIFCGFIFVDLYFVDLYFVDLYFALCCIFIDFQ